MKTQLNLSLRGKIVTPARNVLCLLLDVLHGDGPGFVVMDSGY